MTIQDVKQIKLADYLQSLGYTPVKQQGRNLWYKSPLREETDASFKVNTELEKWYDFGIGKGGNIIALAAELYRSEDVAYLLRRIEERTAYIRPASFSFGRQHSDNQPYQGLKVGELSSPALIAYLQERGINIGLAKRECRELRFMNADKPYFAIGFPNMAGGYEVRNRYFKGCVAPKDITHIRQQGGQRCMCYLFEGFMDYLSFLTIRVENNPQHPRLDTQDYIILNSVSNLAKAENLLETYTQIGCFLDNDTAGRNTCKKLKEKFGERMLDKSMYYRDYKDLNDYLCGKPLSQSAEPIKEKKQVQSARRMMQPPKRKGDFICNMHVRSPKVFRQKYHSSIGRFLHALLRNAKNTLSSQREIPLETLCKRGQKPNSFGLCRVQQGLICIINPVNRCHRQREET